MSAISVPQRSSGAWARLREHLRRAVGREGNPLCRPVDRARSRLVLLMLAALLVTALAAVLIAQAVLGAEQRAARQLIGHRHQVVATTVSSSTEDGVPGGATRSVAQAVWTFPGTVAESGTVPVPPSTPAGATVTVWVNDAGRPATAPHSTTDQVTHAAVAGLGAWSALMLTAEAGYTLRRRSLDRRAEREWEPDWELVEPIWSGRGRPGQEKT